MSSTRLAVSVILAGVAAMAFAPRADAQQPHHPACGHVGQACCANPPHPSSGGQVRAGDGLRHAADEQRRKAAATTDPALKTKLLEEATLLDEEAKDEDASARRRHHTPTTTRCQPGLECRGNCEPAHHADRELPQGRRSVRVVLMNRTSHALRFAHKDDEHGQWSLNPARAIAAHDYAEWQTDSDGFMTGTEESAYFSIDGFHMTQAETALDRTGHNQKDLYLHWDNPFMGNNSYREWAPRGFKVSRVGGEGNRTTVFYTLREAGQPENDCNALWVVNHLSKEPNDALSGGDEFLGAFTTMMKKAGLAGWTHVGCNAHGVGTAVRDAQWSSDGFWTIDVWLDSLEVGGVSGTAGQRRAMRLEVRPGTAAHEALGDKILLAAHRRPRRGERIKFSGPVMIDHGHFLEVHPQAALVFPAP